jgi:hypothetical protein
VVEHLASKCEVLSSNPSATKQTKKSKQSLKEERIPQEYLSMVVHDCNPSYLAGRSRRISGLRPISAKLLRPYLKNKIQKAPKGWGKGASNSTALA